MCRPIAYSGNPQSSRVYGIPKLSLPCIGIPKLPVSNFWEHIRIEARKYMYNSVSRCEPFYKIVSMFYLHWFNHYCMWFWQIEMSFLSSIKFNNANHCCLSAVWESLKLVWIHISLRPFTCKTCDYFRCLNIRHTSWTTDPFPLLILSQSLFYGVIFHLDIV